MMPNPSSSTLKPCYRLFLAYDGCDFSGWQVQPNGLSIQELVQDALGVLLKEKVTVIGSGRTDAGVHALRQVAHFHTFIEIDCGRVRYALNGILPHSIRIWQVERAPPGFHSCYSAIGKVYHYRITTKSVQSPFTRGFRWFVRYPLDVDLMREAAKLLVGTHDFTSFANEPSAGSVAKNPVRTVQRLDIVDDEEGIRIECEGNGFLYKMVRNLVGTLVDVGRGRLAVESVAEILAARDRRKASSAAPPYGLSLVHVHYPESLLNEQSS